MSEYAKIATTHLRRAAVVYVRQSSASQLERNRESTDRQYALIERAVSLGWPRGAVRVIDADLGVSGSRGSVRSGFSELTSMVALGQVGIVLALEVSRLARSNTDWYRLLDLAGLTDTLLADTDGVYHPGLFNDRLTLGLKGTMAEAELHVLRARLDGGIRNKAVRGELRRGLPVGLVWGEEPGEIRLHPDEAVTGVIGAIFKQFVACGSVRATWLWLRGEGLSFPLQRSGRPELDWVAPDIHRGPPCADQSGLRWRLRLRQDPSGAARGRDRDRAPAAPSALSRRVGGAHPRASRRVHRLGHLAGQPGADRSEHPPGRPRRR